MFVSLMGEEMLSDESFDDDELSWMALLKQHGFTIILAVFLMGLYDSDEVLDLVISRLWLARIIRLREVMVMVWIGSMNVGQFIGRTCYEK